MVERMRFAFIRVCGVKVIGRIVGLGWMQTTKARRGIRLGFGSPEERGGPEKLKGDGMCRSCGGRAQSRSDHCSKMSNPQLLRCRDALNATVLYQEHGAQ